MRESSMEPEGKMIRIKELEREIADLETRLPAHSVPPAMIGKLEELEEELEKLKAALTRPQMSGSGPRPERE